MIFSTILFACTAGTDTPTPEPTERTIVPATPPTTDTDAPDDSGIPMVEIRYRVYEEDRECWGLRIVERPAEYWQPWVDASCGDNLGQRRAYWIDEGHCGLFARPLVGPSGCAIDDPTGWFSACDPDEHLCCALAEPPFEHTGQSSNIVACQDSPYYEP